MQVGVDDRRQASGFRRLRRAVSIFLIIIRYQRDWCLQIRQRLCDTLGKCWCLCRAVISSSRPGNVPSLQE